MLFALDICIKRNAPPNHNVHLGLNPPLKKITPSFLPNPLLNLQTVQAPLFRQFTPNILVFHEAP